MSSRIHSKRLNGHIESGFNFRSYRPIDGRQQGFKGRKNQVVIGHFESNTAKYIPYLMSLSRIHLHSSFPSALSPKLVVAPLEANGQHCHWPHLVGELHYSIDIAAHQLLLHLTNETLGSLLPSAVAPLKNVLVEIQCRIEPQTDSSIQ